MTNERCLFRVRARRYGVAVALLVAVTPCTEGRVGAEAPIVVVRDTVADTVIVDNQGDRALGLVEELRIGRLEGDEAYTFGRIGTVATDRDGRLYVYDGAFGELRVYEPDGAFVRRIGRKGGGPGEFSTVWGVAILDDGRVLVRDAHRVVVFSSSGEALTTWPARGSVTLAQPVLLPDGRGGVFVRVGAGATRRGDVLHLHQAYLHLDSAGGLIDTVPSLASPEPRPNRSRFDPGQVATLHPVGWLVAERTNEYAIELRRHSGGMLRVRRSGVTPPEVLPEERADYESMYESGSRRIPTMGSVTVPATKPLIRSLRTDPAGRLWVRRWTTAVEMRPRSDTVAGSIVDHTDRWQEPEVWDVFDSTGVVHGTVALPIGASLRAVNGDRIYGVVPMEDDVPVIVVWRIEPGLESQAAAGSLGVVGEEVVH